MTIQTSTSKLFAYALYLNTVLQSPRTPTFASPFPASGMETGELALINTLLNGQAMPGFDALARYLFHSATGQPLIQVPAPVADGYIGETANVRVHLLYHRNRTWLRSNAAVLDAQLTQHIEQDNAQNKPCIVFAAARFISPQILAEKHITFYQLPYALSNHVLLNSCSGQIAKPSPTALSQYQHRANDDNGWRELDYERDILGHLNWQALHFRETAAFAADLHKQAHHANKNMSTVAEAELSSACQVWRLLNVIPNPWQGVRLLEEALALLSDQGFSEATLLAARPALVQAILDDVQLQVARQANALFQRKLAMAEIKQRPLQRLQ